jgi:hypothetical protein
MENNFFFFSIKGLAIASQILQLLLAGLACFWSATLFRRNGSLGWLLLGGVFLEPFALVAMRMLRGGPWLAYKTMSAGADGVMNVTYRVDFRFFYIISVFGLFLLTRTSKHEIRKS